MYTLLYYNYIQSTKLIEFIAASKLDILNQGNEPILMTQYRREVIDITLASPSTLRYEVKWRVSPDETSPDHRNNYI